MNACISASFNAGDMMAVGVAGAEGAAWGFMRTGEEAVAGGFSGDT